MNRAPSILAIAATLAVGIVLGMILRPAVFPLPDESKGLRATIVSLGLTVDSQDELIQTLKAELDENNEELGLPSWEERAMEELKGRDKPKD